MPFEPKIFHQESGEPSVGEQSSLPAEPVWNDAELLDLPDDLAMLAEQLHDDATYLAARHPADADSGQREAAWKEHVQAHTQSTPSAGRKHWLSVAAALVVAVACGGWVIYLLGGQGQSEGTIASESETESFVAAERTAHPDRPAPSAAIHPAAIQLPKEQPRLIPATFLQDVSGPELDGMLDLLEGDESGLSI